MFGWGFTLVSVEQLFHLLVLGQNGQWQMNHKNCWKERKRSIWSKKFRQIGILVQAKYRVCLMQIYSYDFVNITFLQRNDFTKDFKAISKNAFFSKFTNFFQNQKQLQQMYIVFTKILSYPWTFNQPKNSKLSYRERGEGRVEDIRFFFCRKILQIRAS